MIFRGKLSVCFGITVDWKVELAGIIAFIEYASGVLIYRFSSGVEGGWCCRCGGSRGCVEKQNGVMKIHGPPKNGTWLS